MRASQYLTDYQSQTLSEISAGRKPYAVGTFLAYRLRGKAKAWSGRYLRSLRLSLDRAGWLPCPSKLGGAAYGPP